jgi:hypothetical protein
LAFTASSNKAKMQTLTVQQLSFASTTSKVERPIKAAVQINGFTEWLHYLGE